MTQALEIAPPVFLHDEGRYTPEEVALYAKCSPGMVRREIKALRLKAFRWGPRQYRIIGEDAKAWDKKRMQAIVSESLPDQAGTSPQDSGALSGEVKKTVADAALVSVLSDHRRRRQKR